MQLAWIYTAYPPTYETVPLFNKCCHFCRSNGALGKFQRLHHQLCISLKLNNQNERKGKLSMKSIIHNTFTTSTPCKLSTRFCVVLVLTAMTGLPAAVQADDGNRYQQVNLVSDQPGVALLQDTNLVNAWGMAFSAGSPFWISDNGSGLATLYSVTNDSAGMVHVARLGLRVTIPGGVPTGQLFNGAGGFKGDIFIFAGEDGTIAGWRSALGTAAETLTNRGTAVYKGITLVTTANGPVLLAANFREGTIDAYGTNASGIALLGQFSDQKAPAGYAPFNVRALGNTVFVTFAKQDDAKHDDVPGRGHGLIDIFDLQTGKFSRFATGSDAGGDLSQINSPWGLAVSPANFGKHGDQLLVGNFGSGTVMSFEANREFQGLLRGIDNHPVIIDGLWGLAFGNGGRAGTPDTLFFTAGPDGESHGLFGSLTPVASGAGDDQGDQD